VAIGFLTLGEVETEDKLRTPLPFLEASPAHSFTELRILDRHQNRSARRRMTSTSKPWVDDPAFVARLEQLEPVTRPPDHPVRQAPWFVDDAVPNHRRTILKFAGFVIMMGVGAAAAALVFHDRVARLLR
jgi:hypothetical protein